MKKEKTKVIVAKNVKLPDDEPPQINRVYFYILLAVRPFANLLMLSFMMIVLFNPVYEFFEKRFRNSNLIEKRLHMTEFFSTLSTMLFIIVGVLLPLAFFFKVYIFEQFVILYNDINEVVISKTTPEALNDLIGTVNTYFERIPYFTYRITSEEVQNTIRDAVKPGSAFLLGSVFNVGEWLIGAIPLMILFLFILWAGFGDFKRFISYYKKISPFPEHIDNLYINRITGMTRGIVLGTFIIAIIQGVVSGITLVFAGVPYAFFWTLLMIFLAIVPLGTGFVMVPLGVVLILMGHVWEGLLVLGVQTFIVSNIDNFLRPYLVPRDADIHPIIMLLAILGGIQVFGFFGVIYGPLIMVVLITTLEIYVKYYKPKQPYKNN
jgi:predicted PurR-regulated permease PerM